MEAMGFPVQRERLHELPTERQPLVVQSLGWRGEEGERPAVVLVEIRERHLHAILAAIAALDLVVVASRPLRCRQARAQAPVVRIDSRIPVGVGPLLRVLGDVGNVEGLHARSTFGLHARDAVGVVREPREGAVRGLVVEDRVPDYRLAFVGIPRAAQRREAQGVGDARRGAHLVVVARGKHGALEPRIRDGGAFEELGNLAEVVVAHPALVVEANDLASQLQAQSRIVRVLGVRLVHAGVDRIGQERIGRGVELRRVIVEVLGPEVRGIHRLEADTNSVVGRRDPTQHGAHRAALGRLRVVRFLEPVVAWAQLDLRDGLA